MRTPIILVSGGLGSGKTTLLKSIAATNPDVRFGVIVNEFGEVGIDGDLLRSHIPTLVEIKNGCICCVTQDQFLPAIKSVLAQFEVDVLLVEMSGAGDPGPVIRQLSVLAPLVEQKCHLVLADLTADVAAATKDIVFRTALTLADCVLLTKQDVATPDAIEQWTTFLSSLGLGGRLIDRAHCLSPARMIAASADPVPNGRTPRAWAIRRGHIQKFKTVSQTVGHITSGELKTLVDRLGEKMSRIKGIVRLDGVWTEIHAVRGVLTAEAYPGEAPEIGRLVLISATFSQADLAELVRANLAVPVEAVS
jgi:G3E family GTPase